MKLFSSSKAFISIYILRLRIKDLIPTETCIQSLAFGSSLLFVLKISQKTINKNKTKQCCCRRESWIFVLI